MLKHESGILPEYDDRREIRRMLEHLTPRRRIEFLKWCCQAVSSRGVTTYVEKNDGTVSGVWSDLMTLCWGSGLTIRQSGDRLHEMVKGKV